MVDWSAGITGNALPKDIETFYNAGADLVVVKPITMIKILDAIRISSQEN